VTRLTLKRWGSRRRSRPPTFPLPRGEGLRVRDKLVSVLRLRAFAVRIALSNGKRYIGTAAGDLSGFGLRVRRVME
jgi:hypothetical protein